MQKAQPSRSTGAVRSLKPKLQLLLLLWIAALRLLPTQRQTEQVEEDTIPMMGKEISQSLLLPVIPQAPVAETSSLRAIAGEDGARDS